MKAQEMREPTFLVLAALADASRHGYGIMQEVEAMSDGRVQLRAGTLYAALERLLGEGLIAESGHEVIDGRHRRYYILTEPGSAALTAETQRMQANAREAIRRLKTRPVPGPVTA